MALYFITYDLRKQRDYDSLYQELKNFKAVRILESTWCFKRPNTNVRDLRAHFKKILDSDDGLVISEVADWGTYKTEGSPNDL